MRSGSPVQDRSIVTSTIQNYCHVVFLCSKFKFKGTHIQWASGHSSTSRTSQKNHIFRQDFNHLEQDFLVHEFLTSNIKRATPICLPRRKPWPPTLLPCAKMKNSNRSSIEPLPLHNMHSLISAVNQLRDFSGVKQANPKRIHQIKDQFRLHLPA